MNITPVAVRPNFTAKVKLNNEVQTYLDNASYEELDKFNTSLVELDKFNKNNVIEFRKADKSEAEHGGFVAHNITTDKYALIENKKLPRSLNPATWFGGKYENMTLSDAVNRIVTHSNLYKTTEEDQCRASIKSMKNFIA